MRVKLDELLEWRVREIAQLKTLLPKEADPKFEVICRAAMVLSYAHWEGFFNECVKTVMESLSDDHFDISQATPGIVSLFISRDIDSLTNKKLNDDNVVSFLNSIQAHTNTSVSGSNVEGRAASSRSNLDWHRLIAVFSLFGYSWRPLNDDRIFIQHQLARLRHEIAHGSSPRLRREHAIAHLSCTEKLLDDVADYFVSIFEDVLCPLKVGA